MFSPSVTELERNAKKNRANLSDEHEEEEEYDLKIEDDSDEESAESINEENQNIEEDNEENTEKHIEEHTEEIIEENIVDPLNRPEIITDEIRDENIIEKSEEEEIIETKIQNIESLTDFICKRPIPSNRHNTKRLIDKVIHQFDLNTKPPEFELVFQCCREIDLRINEPDSQDLILQLIQFVITILNEIKYQKQKFNNNQWLTDEKIEKKRKKKEEKVKLQQQQLKSTLENLSSTEKQQKEIEYQNNIKSLMDSIEEQIDMLKSRKRLITNVFLRLMKQTNEFDEIKINACMCYLTVAEIVFPKEMPNFFSDCIGQISNTSNEPQIIISFLFIIRKAIEDGFFNERLPLFDRYLSKILTLQLQQFAGSQFESIIFEFYLELFNSIFPYLRKYIDTPKYIRRYIDTLFGFGEQYRPYTYKILSTFFKSFYDKATTLDFENNGQRILFYEDLFPSIISSDLKSNNPVLQLPAIKFLMSIAQKELQMNQNEIRDATSKNLIRKYSKLILQSIIDIVKSHLSFYSHLNSFIQLLYKITPKFSISYFSSENFSIILNEIKNRFEELDNQQFCRKDADGTIQPISSNDSLHYIFSPILQSSNNSNQNSIRYRLFLKELSKTDQNNIFYQLAQLLDRYTENYTKPDEKCRSILQNQFDKLIQESQNQYQESLLEESLQKEILRALQLFTKTSRNLMPQIIDFLRESIKSSKPESQYASLRILSVSVDLIAFQEVFPYLNPILERTDSVNNENVVIAAYTALSKIIKRFPNKINGHVQQIVNIISISNTNPIFYKLITSILKVAKFCHSQNNQLMSNPETEKHLIEQLNELIMNKCKDFYDVLYAYSALHALIDATFDASTLFNIFELLISFLQQEQNEMSNSPQIEIHHLCMKTCQLIKHCLNSITTIQNTDIQNAFERTSQIMLNLFGCGFDSILIDFFSLYIQNTETSILHNINRLYQLLEIVSVYFDLNIDYRVIISGTEFLNNLFEVLISNPSLAQSCISEIKKAKIVKHIPNDLIIIDNPILSELQEIYPFLDYYQTILNQDEFVETFPAVISSLAFVIKLLSVDSISLCEYFIPIINKFSPFTYQPSIYQELPIEAIFEALCQVYLAICGNLLEIDTSNKENKTEIITDISKKIARPIFNLFRQIYHFELFDQNLDFYNFVIFIIFHLNTVARSRIALLIHQPEIQDIINKAIITPNVDPGISQIAQRLQTANNLHSSNQFFCPS